MDEFPEGLWADDGDDDTPWQDDRDDDENEFGGSDSFGSYLADLRNPPPPGVGPIAARRWPPPVCQSTWGMKAHTCRALAERSRAALAALPESRDTATWIHHKMQLAADLSRSRESIGQARRELSQARLVAKTARLRGEEVDCLTMLAETHVLGYGNWETAIVLYRQAIALAELYFQDGHPARPKRRRLVEMMVALANLLEKMGDRPEAARWWGRIELQEEDEASRLRAAFERARLVREMGESVYAAELLGAVLSRKEQLLSQSSLYREILGLPEGHDAPFDPAVVPLLPIALRTQFLLLYLELARAHKGCPGERYYFTRTLAAFPPSLGVTSLHRLVADEFLAYLVRSNETGEARDFIHRLLNKAAEGSGHDTQFELWLVAHRYGLLPEKHPWLRAYESLVSMFDQPVSFKMESLLRALHPRWRPAPAPVSCQARDAAVLSHVHREARRLYRRAGDAPGEVRTILVEVRTILAEVRQAMPIFGGGTVTLPESHMRRLVRRLTLGFAIAGEHRDIALRQELHEQRGRLLAILKQHEAAASDFACAAQLLANLGEPPESMFAQVDWVGCLVQLGRLDEADVLVHRMKAWLKENPEHDNHSRLDLCCDRMRRMVREARAAAGQ